MDFVVALGWPPLFFLEDAHFFVAGTPTNSLVTPHHNMTVLPISQHHFFFEWAEQKIVEARTSLDGAHSVLICNSSVLFFHPIDFVLPDVKFESTELGEVEIGNFVLLVPVDLPTKKSSVQAISYVSKSFFQ